MKMFGDLKADDHEEEGDVLGGDFLLDTGIYDATIKLAYSGKSRTSNARSLILHLDIDGREYRETIWISNREGKTGYPDRNDPKKTRSLPGFTTANDIALLTTGEGLLEQASEEKVVKLYDPEARKEIPQNVPVAINMIGEPITVGIYRQRVNKQVKNSQGVYVDSAEEREENIINKVFRTECKRTVAEIRMHKEEAAFYDRWLNQNDGKVFNRVRPVDGNTGRPGGGSSSSGSKAQDVANLFKK